MTRSRSFMPIGCRPATQQPGQKVFKSVSVAATRNNHARIAHREGRHRSRWTSLRAGGSSRGIHCRRTALAGVVACPARGPGRYFGSDAAAAERIVDVVESLDIECSVGVADVLAVAVLSRPSR